MIADLSLKSHVPKIAGGVDDDGSGEKATKSSTPLLVVRISLKAQTVCPDPPRDFDRGRTQGSDHWLED